MLTLGAGGAWALQRSTSLLVRKPMYLRTSYVERHLTWHLLVRKHWVPHGSSVSLRVILNVGGIPKYYFAGDVLGPEMSEE